MDPSRLASAAFFSSLPAADLEMLAAAASETTVTAGDVVVAKGDFGHAIYVIESGTAAVHNEDAALRELGPGDVFGEIAIVVAGRRTASVVATSSMRLITIFKRDLWALERRSPEAAQRLRALIASRRAVGSTG